MTGSPVTNKLLIVTITISKKQIYSFFVKELSIPIIYPKLEKIPLVETLSSVTNFTILKISSLVGYVVVAMVIEINLEYTQHDWLM